MRGHPNTVEYYNDIGNAKKGNYLSIFIHLLSRVNDKSNTASMSALHAASQRLRIAIAGGGPAGLTLASILSREGEGLFDIRVFESGERGGYQGNGWDIDERGGKALTRAGVDMKRIQREGSNTWRLYKAADEAKISYCLRDPSFLKYIGIDLLNLNLETSRTTMIEMLQKQIESGANPSLNGSTDNDKESSSRGLVNGKNQAFEIKASSRAIASIEHEVRVGGIVSDVSSSSSPQSVTLLDSDGESLGEYDIIVDAMGVVSKLRRYRFASGPIYTNSTFVQGIILAPEQSCSQEFVERLGEGTLAIAGPTKDGKGTIHLAFQRHGSSLTDTTTNFSLQVYTRGPSEISDMLDLGRFHGVSFDTAQVSKIKAFLLSQLDNPGWSSIYRDAVAAMDGGRILPIYMHPAMKDLIEQQHSRELPLLSIGDSLHALPPWSGSSGNFALADAADTATALIDYAKRESTSTSKSPQKLASMLRNLEHEFLCRADGRIRDRCLQRATKIYNMQKSLSINSYDFATDFATDVFPPNHGSSSFGVFLIQIMLKAITFLNYFENYGIRVASATPSIEPMSKVSEH